MVDTWLLEDVMEVHFDCTIRDFRRRPISLLESSSDNQRIIYHSRSGRCASDFSCPTRVPSPISEGTLKVAPSARLRGIQPGLIPRRQSKEPSADAAFCSNQACTAPACSGAMLTHMAQVNQASTRRQSFPLPLLIAARKTCAECV